MLELVFGLKVNFFKALALAVKSSQTWLFPYDAK
jgi:hypothetical protein